MNLSMKEVKEITGLPDRRIKQLSESGVLSLKLRTGKGKFRKYSTMNLVELAIAEKLADIGIELNRICIIVPAFSKMIIERINKLTKDIDTLRSDELMGMFLIVTKDKIGAIYHSDPLGQSLAIVTNVSSKEREAGSLSEVYGQFAEANGAIYLRVDELIMSIVQKVNGIDVSR